MTDEGGIQLGIDGVEYFYLPEAGGTQVREALDRLLSPDLREQILTPGEVLESGAGILGQEEVAIYHSTNPKVNGGGPDRERTLRMPDWARVYVSAGYPLTPTARHTPEEGLKKMLYWVFLANQVISDLATEGANAQDAVLMKVMACDMRAMMQGGETIGDLDAVVSAELVRQMTDQYLGEIHISPEELEFVREKVGNWVFSLYKLIHDEHLQLRSQGGLDQLPVHIANHLIRHNKRAEICFKALRQVREQRGNPDLADIDFDEVEQYLAWPAMLNVAAANLLRNSPPLSPSFSDTAIKKHRMEILQDADQILPSDEYLGDGRELLLELAGIIGAGKLEDEEGIESLDTRYHRAVSMLGSMAEIVDRDNALQLLDEVIPDVDDVKTDEQYQLDVLQEMMIILQTGHSAIHLETLTEQQYNAMLWLQKCTGRNILRQIAVPPLHHGIRPGWDVEMDTIWHSPNREDTIETLGVWLNNASSSLSDDERSQINQLLNALQLARNPLLLNETAITTRLSEQHLALLKKIEDLSGKRLLAAKIPLVFPAFTGTRLRQLHDVLSRPFYQSLWPHAKSSRAKELSSKELGRLSQTEQERLRGGLTMQEMVEAHLANSVAEHYLKGLFPDMEPQEVRQHMWGDEYGVEPPSVLQGVDKAAIVIRDVILQFLREDGGKIAVMGDCDEDGMNASALCIRALKALTGQDVDFTLNNRIEGHNVQFVDLLNFTLRGNRTIVINDMGSGAEEVKTYRLFREGVSCIEDLQVFYEICDKIEDVNMDGKDYISTRRPKNQVTRFTSFVTRARELFETDKESAYRNVAGMEAYFETNPEAGWDEYFQSILGDFVRSLDPVEDLALIRFINGSPDVNLVIIDHHTPSIESVRYLQEQKLRAIVENIGTVFPHKLPTSISKEQFTNADLTTIRKLRGRLTQVNGGYLDRKVLLTIEEQGALGKLEALIAAGAIRLPDELNQIIMVNPEWVRAGQEGVFLEEMQEVLETKDAKEIREVQHRHRCYTTSELVGSMVAWKVTARLFELFNTDTIVQADAEELFGLGNEERATRLTSISRQIREGLFTDETDASGVDVVNFGGEENAVFKLDVHELLKQKGANAKIRKALSEFRNNWLDTVGRAHKQYLGDNPQGNWQGFVMSDYYQQILDFSNFNVEVIDNEALKELVSAGKYQSVFGEKLLVAMQVEVNQKFKKRVTELIENGELGLGEARFYLAYNRETPKSLFDRDETEKAVYFTRLARRVGIELGQMVQIQDKDGELHSVNFSGYGGSWADIKKSLYERINAHLRDYGAHTDIRITDGKFTKEKRLILARQLTDEYWNQAVAKLMEQGGNGSEGITPEEAVFLNAWARGRAYGSKQGLINAAIAQIVDYGKIRGEGRLLVRQAMDLVTDEITRAYDRSLSLSEKLKLRSRLPPVLRILNTATTANLNQLSMHLTRNWTHSWGAAQNLLYRCRAIVGRDEYADKLLKHAIIFITTRRESPDISRLRKAIEQEREWVMEYREELFDKAKRTVLSESNRRKKKGLPARDNVVTVKLMGNQRVEPLLGVMGLVGGDLAREFGKPALVFHRIKNKAKGKPETVRCSVRLPNEGTINWDMVLMNWRLNPMEGFVVTKCGGHPGAAGAEIEILDMEKFLDAVNSAFEGFEQTGRFSGVVRLDDIKPKVLTKLQEEGLVTAQTYGLLINHFNVARIIGESIAQRILEPYGKDTPNLEVDISGVKVLDMVHGQRTKDDNEYIVVKMEDSNGHVEELRVFNKLHEWRKIQIGDVLTVRVEARMRMRPAVPARVQTSMLGVQSDGSDSGGYQGDTIRGYVPKSKLYINMIVSNDRITEP